MGADAATIEVKETERVEVQLPALDHGTYAGYQVVKTERRALPLGSSLNASAGTFYWQPAAGFLGRYDMLFVANGNEPDAVRVSVIVGPPVRMAVDTPSVGARLSQPFELSGWSIDLAAGAASGIDAVHAWAYPTTGGEPMFVGGAAPGSLRPDVAATYGDEFERSSYRIVVVRPKPGVYDLTCMSNYRRLEQPRSARTMRVWPSVLVLLIAVTAAAQQKPDFSGHWSLASPNSAPADVARELAVRQFIEPSVTVLTVERRFNGEVRSNTYQVGIEGGTVGGLVAGRGSGPNGQIPQTRFSITWKGDALEIETGSYSGPTTDSGPFSEHKEVWSLDARGMLSITTTDRATGAEPRTATLTYRR